MKKVKVIADTFNEIATRLESNFRLIVCEKSYHLILRDCKHKTYIGIIRNVATTDNPLGEWHFYPVVESCWSILEEFCVSPILKEAGVEKLFDLREKKDINTIQDLAKSTNQ